MKTYSNFENQKWLSKLISSISTYEDNLVSFDEFIKLVFKSDLEKSQIEHAKEVLVNGKMWDWNREYSLFVWLWGKGAGKGTLAVALELYAFYSLIEMVNPQRFFKILPDDEIAFVNVALSGDQSRVNIFDRIKTRIIESNFFKDRYTIIEKSKQLSSGDRGKIVVSSKVITFVDKNIKIYSEHSEYEHWEGKNIVFFVLDEYSGAKSQVELEWARGVLNSLITSNRELPYIGIVMSYMRLDPEFDATYQLVKRIENGEIEKAKASVRFPWELRPQKYAGEFFIYEDNETKKRYLVPISLKQQFQIDEDSSRRKYLNIAGRRSEGEIFMNYPEKISECIVNRPDAIDYIEEFVPAFDRILYTIKVKSVNLNPNFKYVIAIDKGEKNSDTALAIAHKEKHKVGDEYIDKIIIDSTIVWRPERQLNLTVDTDNVTEVLLEILRHLNKNQVIVRIDHWQSSDLINKCLKMGYRAIQKNASKKGYEILRDMIEALLIEFPNTKAVEQGKLQLKYLKGRGDAKPRVSIGKQDVVDVWAEVCEELIELKDVKLAIGKVVSRGGLTSRVDKKVVQDIENFFIHPFYIRRFPVGRVITPQQRWSMIKKRVGE